MRGLYRNFLLIAAFTASLSHAGWKGGYGMGQVNVANGGKIVFANGATISGDSASDFIVTGGTDAGTDTILIPGNATGDLFLKDEDGDKVFEALSGQSGTFINGPTGGREIFVTSTGIAGTNGSTPISIDSGSGIQFANGATISGDTAAATIIQGGDGQELQLIMGNTSGDDLVIYEGTGDGSTARAGFLGAGTVYMTDSAGTQQFAIDTSGLQKNASTGVAFAQGLTVATGETLAFANGFTLSGDTASASIIQGGDGQNLDIIAGNTAGDDIRFLEGTGDGSNDLLSIQGGGNMQFRSHTSGAIEAQVVPGGLLLATGSSLDFANGFTLSGDTASASIIQGGDGQTLQIIAGNTAGDDIDIIEGTGDSSTVRFNIAGGADTAIRSGAGALTEVIGSTSGRTVLYGGAQVGDADGEKLYFGGTSHYLEWDTGLNALLLNGSTTDYIDLDTKVFQANYITADVSFQCEDNPGLCTIGATGGATVTYAPYLYGITDSASPPKDPSNGVVTLWADNTSDTLKVTDQASTDGTITHGTIDIVAP